MLSLRTSGALGCECQPSSTEAAYALADSTPIQRPSSSDAVKREYTDQRGEHVGDVVQTSHPLSVARSNPRQGENVRAVDRDASDTDPLLQDLEPDDELYTTSRVKLALFDAEEHGKVALLLRILSLQLHYVADIFKFGIRPAFLFARVTTQAGENEVGFVFAANFGQPAWAVEIAVISVW